MPRRAVEQWAIQEDIAELEHDVDCESTWIEGANLWSQCDCARRMRGLA